MAFAYPLDLPDLKFGQLVWTCFDVVGRAASPFSLVAQVQQHPGDAWQAEVQVARKVYVNNSAEWRVFLAEIRGRFGTFRLGDPLGQTPRGTPAGSPLVKGADQTGNSLITDGWTVSAADVLLAGDYIQIGERLHMVLEDIDADGAGEATLPIWPRLRESPADDAAVITSGCTGLFRLAANARGFRARPPHWVEISFSAEEAL